jgi:hypothetical protein
MHGCRQLRFETRVCARPASCRRDGRLNQLMAFLSSLGQLLGVRCDREALTVEHLTEQCRVGPYQRHQSAVKKIPTTRPASPARCNTLVACPRYSTKPYRLLRRNRKRRIIIGIGIPMSHSSPPVSIVFSQAAYLMKSAGKAFHWAKGRVAHPGLVVN